MFLDGEQFVYKHIQRKKEGKKYFNHIIYRLKTPTPAGNKRHSVLFIFPRQHLFHLSKEKFTVLISNQSEMDIKVFIPHNAMKTKHKQKIKKTFHKKILLKNASKNVK